MARQSRGRSAPARKPAAQQSRPATTYAPSRSQAPSAATPRPPAPAATPAAAASSQGPGMLGQIATTAAGVAVGSSIGHAVGSFFTGGSSEASAAPTAAAPAGSDQQQQQSSFGNCQAVFTMFTNCMDQNGNDGNACQWYLQQLKSCQEAQTQ